MLLKDNKKSLLHVFDDYKAKREKVFARLDVEKLRDDLHQLKKESIKNIKELKKQAIVNLKNFGVNVFEVNNYEEAGEVLKKLTDGADLIVKSKSNVINNLNLKKVLAGKEIIETDTGDFLAELAGQKGEHHISPAVSLDIRTIVRAIKEKLNSEVEENPQAIVSFVREYLRQKIIQAQIGLTGANALTTEGQVVILENEGNISLVSRLPARHVVITSTKKIVPTIEDAMLIVKCSAIWGTGQAWPVYVSIIAGPSKTADIEKKLITGAQGAKEVDLILINDHQNLINTPFEEILYCISCGACLNFCPVFLIEHEKIDYKFANRIFKCTLCGSCKLNCPAKIDLGKITKVARAKFAQEGKASLTNEKMIENIRHYGNPFGKIDSGETPKELFCC
jgi:L-lactate utilization protein LutB